MKSLLCHFSSILVLAAAVPAIACSASDSTSPADSGMDGTGGSAGDVLTDTPEDHPEGNAPTNCVPPGTPNNEKGVGGYCHPGGSECVWDGGGLHLCTADVGQPFGSWFCTAALCTTDGECGTGAMCVHAAQGNGCVPLSCLGPAGDAGADAPGDSAGDETAD